MILPIYAIGQPVLKQRAPDVDLNDKEGILAFVADLIETMQAASGLGRMTPKTIPILSELSLIL
jgi:peptide deformylase